MSATSDRQMARHVRALYEYNVGQRAALGKLLLGVFAAAALVFFLATAGSMVSAIVAGMTRIH